MAPMRKLFRFPLLFLAFLSELPPRRFVRYSRRMKITDVLRAEHAVFHNLFDHIEATVPGLKTLAEVKALAAVVQKVHEPHAHTEDDLFMEPLEHCFDQIGQQETFHEEHEHIEKALAQSLAAKTVKDAKRLLLGAIAASRDHFDKEERIVFPMAERVLKAKTLSELGQAWLRRRQTDADSSMLKVKHA
jgi:hemerythrin-like domain-containing protein